MSVHVTQHLSYVHKNSVRINLKGGTQKKECINIKDSALFMLYRSYMKQGWMKWGK